MLPRWFWDGLDHYEISASWGLEFSSSEPVAMVDKFQTLHLLDRFSTDFRGMHQLRALLVDLYPGQDLNLLDDHQVKERLACGLVAGKLRLHRRRTLLPRDIWLPLEQPVEAIKPVEDKTEHQQTWVKFRLLDDQSGRPISGLQLKITFSDGYAMNLRTSASGNLDIQQIPEGPCELSCDLDGAQLDRTVVFAAQSDSPTGAEPHEFQVETPSFANWIANIEARKVKKGDSLTSLAKEVNLSVEQLAEFNFGTRDPQEIQRYLAGCVGCDNQDDKGKVILDDQDDPGVIFLPQRWFLSDVPTSQVNTIRLRALSHRILMLYEIDVDAPENKDDIISLESTDGSWRNEVQVGSLQEIEEDLVELSFPLPPYGNRYNLIQDPGDGEDPFIIMRNTTRTDLLGEPPEEVK